MRICSSIWRFRCVVTATFALAGVAMLSSADSIIITRPAIAIVAPEKEDHSLPKTRRSEEISFSGTTLPQPVLPTHQVIQRYQSRTEDDEEDNVHPLLRDPRKLPGIFGKDPLKPPPTLSERSNPLRLPWRTSDDDEKEGRSLSPVNSLDWNEREPRAGKGELTQRHLGREESQDPRQSDPFRSARERVDQGQNPMQMPMTFNPLAFRPREKPTAAELERRATFQELLNPQPAVALKQAGSLEPVTAFETPEPLNRPSPGPSPLPATPAITSGQNLIGRGPVDPNEAFQRRQARLVGADFEDPAKPFAVGTQPKASPKPVEPLHQTPLLRQPIQRDIPTRQF